jgi:hypothetical protein
MFEASLRNLPRGAARASCNDSSAIGASKAVQRRVRRSRKSIASKDLLARHQIVQLEARVKILEKRNQGQKKPTSPLLGDLKKSSAKHGKKAEEVKEEREKGEIMIKSLKHQITDLEEELKAQKILVVDLQEQLLLQKPILDVGVAIRRRYLERAKQNFVDGQYVDARGTANQQLIEAGHVAAHRANCRL